MTVQKQQHRFRITGCTAVAEFTGKTLFPSGSPNRPGKRKSILFLHGYDVVKIAARTASFLIEPDCEITGLIGKLSEIVVFFTELPAARGNFRKRLRFRGNILYSSHCIGEKSIVFGKDL